jgi:hypothetical protein
MYRSEFQSSSDGAKGQISLNIPHPMGIFGGTKSRFPDRLHPPTTVCIGILQRLPEFPFEGCMRHPPPQAVLLFLQLLADAKLEVKNLRVRHGDLL